ncbi:MAG: HAMP domain-containing histidine kinase [Polyangiaceae bacterium]|nr:HAMP domain-containing histidine kinase [Polyangiaceae bacterium]
MRSVKTERRSSTLMGRVARVAALAALGGGFFAALAALILAEIKVEHAEDRRLTEEASEIVFEVSRLSDAELLEHVEKETEELERVNLRFAVHRGEVFFGGDANLPRLEYGCVTNDVRLCVVKDGPWSCVVAADDAPTLGLAFMVTILGGAAIIAALLGALTSRRLARWAIEPLVRLGERLGDAPMDQATDLGADDGVIEIDTLRKTLRDLLDRRADALRSARLFAAGAAHELRTPLTTLSGELQLLGEESHAPSIQDRIAALQSSTAHIVELVERLLVFARVGAAEAAEAMRHDAVELGDVLEQVCRRASRNVMGRLTYEPRAMPVVRGDESLLSVLFDNAVNNAILHASPADVRVVLDEQDGDVFVDVIDEGPGIDPRERVRLFEPFQRGTATRPGAGLGLALVGQIARAHGGEAVFVDAAGGGAHLRVRLPPWAPRPAKA